MFLYFTATFSIRTGHEYNFISQKLKRHISILPAILSMNSEACTHGIHINPLIQEYYPILQFLAIHKSVILIYFLSLFFLFFNLFSWILPLNAHQSITYTHGISFVISTVCNSARENRTKPNVLSYVPVTWAGPAHFLPRDMISGMGVDRWVAAPLTMSVSPGGKPPDTQRLSLPKAGMSTVAKSSA